MTQELRLLFDDCLSKHAIAALATLASYSDVELEVAHLATIQQSGKSDDEWIPEIAEKGYVVITTDRGKKPSRGGKLPFLCRKHGVTHVMLSAAMHRRNQFDKIRAILSLWPELLAIAAENPRGAGFSLRLHGGKRLSPILARVSEAPTPGPRLPNEQPELF